MAGRVEQAWNYWLRHGTGTSWKRIRQIFVLLLPGAAGRGRGLGLPEDVIEDADTFEGNALEKRWNLVRRFRALDAGG